MVPSSDAERAEVRAASIQHRAALVVLDELARADSSIDALAERLAVNGDHLRRKLYGKAPASLTDIAAWAGALGLVPELVITKAGS